VRCGRWTSWQEAGRSGTGTVDPSSRARYTGRNMNIWNMYTNISCATYPVIGVCTLAVQWEYMRTVCRRSQVRIWFAFFFNPDQHRYELVCTGMYWILISFLFLQIYRGRNQSEKYHALYRCPLAYLCGCRTQFKLLFTRDNVELRSSGTHDGMSHVEDKSKYLTNAQIASLKRSTKSAPNETGRAHVRNSCNFSPDKYTPQDPTSIRCAQRVVVSSAER
jgi:hypothetical protein